MHVRSSSRGGPLLLVLQSRLPGDHSAATRTHVSVCRVSPRLVASTIATPEAVSARLEEEGPEVCNYENQSAIDIEKAKLILGWAPTPFADVIQATTDWHTPHLTQDSQKL